METLQLPDLDQNLRLVGAALAEWVPVCVGLACFAGLAVMFSFTFLRGR